MMHPDRFRSTVLFFITSLLVFKTFAFEVKAETAIDTTSNKLLLYTGFEYTKGIMLYGVSPFFLSLSAMPGRIKYQGEWHEDLQLKYDCNEDVLILIDDQKNREIELMNEKLDEFYIQGHHFIKTKFEGLPLGYYELLFDGTKKVHVKWIKKIERNQMEEAHYISYHQIYLTKDDQSYTIRTFKEFLNILKSDKKSIIQFCKKNHLRFRKDPFTCMQQVLTHLEKVKQ